MNRIVFSFIFIFLSSQAFSQASYGDNFFVDYNVKINVSTENDSTYLTLILKSEKLKMSDSPKLLFRMMDDSVISLDGHLLSASNKSSGGVVISGIIVSSNYFITEAKFPITKEQMNHFKAGVKKLRLNTSPKYHEKEWKRDKIGAILYNAYVKSSGNSFEDNF